MLLEESLCGLPEALLVGVSGGLDSAALLHALIAQGRKPVVVHFDHGWRKESGGGRGLGEGPGPLGRFEIRRRQDEAGTRRTEDGSGSAGRPLRLLRPDGAAAADSGPGPGPPGRRPGGDFPAPAFARQRLGRTGDGPGDPARRAGPAPPLARGCGGGRSSPTRAATGWNGGRTRPTATCGTGATWSAAACCPTCGGKSRHAWRRIYGGARRSPGPRANGSTGSARKPGRNSSR